MQKVSFFSIIIFLYSVVSAAISTDALNEIKWRTLKIWDKKTNVSGTAVLLDKARGLILTNRHVCTKFASNIEAEFYDTTVVEVLSTKKLPTNPLVDLCALNIKTLIPSKIPMQAPDDRVNIGNFNGVIGESVVYSGFPNRYYITVRSGVVFEDFEYRNKGDKQNINAQYISGVTGSGGSGSGVYDLQAQLIGIVFAYVISEEEAKSKKPKEEGSPAVMVPLKDLKIFLNELGFFK